MVERGIRTYFVNRDYRTDGIYLVIILLKSCVLFCCSGCCCFAFSICKYRLDLNKVARLRADQILRAREQECARDGRPLLLSDFMEQWAASMPGVDTPDHNLLKVNRNSPMHHQAIFSLLSCLLRFRSLVDFFVCLS